MNYWITALLTIAGIILLRLGGRKSISQMTFGTVVVMISLGNLLVEPITHESVWVTLGTVIVMIITLIIVEWVQVKFNFLENIFSGKAVTVIENGQINETNLKKLRMSVDKLEMRLRQQGIGRISDIKTATIEVNGGIGCELKPDKEPLTVGQFENALKTLIPQIQQLMNPAPPTEPSIFDEIEPDSGRAHPERLQ